MPTSFPVIGAPIFETSAHSNPSPQSPSKLYFPPQVSLTNFAQTLQQSQTSKVYPPVQLLGSEMHSDLLHGPQVKADANIHPKLVQRKIRVTLTVTEAPPSTEALVRFPHMPSSAKTAVIYLSRCYYISLSGYT